MSDLLYPNGMVRAKYLRDVGKDESCPRCKFKEYKYIIENNKIYRRIDAFGTGKEVE
jgi:hypothetical protein